MAYLEREVRRLVGKAIHHYHLIEDGDQILVALSGGKDSMVMLNILHERRARVPIDYDLKVVTIDLGYEGFNCKSLETYMRDYGYDLVLKKTQIGPLAHSDANRENPCFLCARLRRKILFETAQELGCNKVALGHTKDDIIETFLLNTFYSGEISTMIPHQVLFGGKLTIIRPLALLEEVKALAYAKLRAFPEVQDGCPTRGTSRRGTVKYLLGELDKMDRRIKKNIFAALSNVRGEYLLNGHGFPH
ncbi:MAG: tRNA 2-thiocytidine(32) synthetase TtcA [Deltaproteobacteria bacterium]|nr:tRNA 2-thiocytidine(32) synthetase TtcA [Deltaproteobacteria bacterium]